MPYGCELSCPAVCWLCWFLSDGCVRVLVSDATSTSTDVCSVSRGVVSATGDYLGNDNAGTLATDGAARDAFAGICSSAVGPGNAQKVRHPGEKLLTATKARPLPVGMAKQLIKGWVQHQ